MQTFHFSHWLAPTVVIAKKHTLADDLEYNGLVLGISGMCSNIGLTTEFLPNFLPMTGFPAPSIEGIIFSDKHLEFKIQVYYFCGILLTFLTTLTLCDAH